MAQQFYVQSKLCSHTKKKKTYRHYLFPDRNVTSLQSIMSLACSSIHKKPVCDKCDAGTSCTKCCTCQPRTRGRPKKASAEQETPHRLNPERRASCTSHFVAEPTSELDTMNEASSNYASSTQIHICHVLKTMGCDEYEKSIRTLP